VSRDDESEEAQLRDLGGVGEPTYLTDEDVRQYSMSDFGLGNADRDDFRP